MFIQDIDTNCFCRHSRLIKKTNELSRKFFAEAKQRYSKQNKIIENIQENKPLNIEKEILTTEFLLMNHSSSTLQGLHYWLIAKHHSN